jgi:hypothetical protein
MLFATHGHPAGLLHPVHSLSDWRMHGRSLQGYDLDATDTVGDFQPTYEPDDPGDAASARYPAWIP